MISSTDSVGGTKAVIFSAGEGKGKGAETAADADDDDNDNPLTLPPDAADEEETPPAISVSAFTSLPLTGDIPIMGAPKSVLVFVVVVVVVIICVVAAVM